MKHFGSIDAREGNTKTSIRPPLVIDLISESMTED